MTSYEKKMSFYSRENINTFIFVHHCHDTLDPFSAQNVGYVFGSSTRGQRALYEMGLTGIPVSNCNNNCSTGSTALFQTRSLVAGGLAKCALALGFEKMQVYALCMY